MDILFSFLQPRTEPRPRRVADLNDEQASMHMTKADCCGRVERDSCHSAQTGRKCDLRVEPAQSKLKPGDHRLRYTRLRSADFGSSASPSHRHVSNRYTVAGNGCTPVLTRYCGQRDCGSDESNFSSDMHLGPGDNRSLRLRRHSVSGAELRHDGR